VRTAGRCRRFCRVIADTETAYILALVCLGLYQYFGSGTEQILALEKEHSESGGGQTAEQFFDFCYALIKLGQEVEPLKFVKYNERHLRATFKTGHYEILTIADGAAYNIWLNGVQFLMSNHTVEQVIEAVQQDYANRVLSGLKYSNN
jgi:hypothetical protein